MRRVDGEREHAPVRGPADAAGRGTPARAVLVEARHRGQRRQRDLDPPAAADDVLRPDHLLHRVSGLDPRPAGGAPPRRGRDGEFHAELRRRAHRRVHGLVPRLGPGPNRSGDHQRSAHPAVEHLHAAYADVVEPTEVAHDARGIDVPVHPVPPRTWAGLVGRIDEGEPDRVGLGARTRLGRWRLVLLHRVPSFQSSARNGWCHYLYAILGTLMCLSDASVPELP